MKYLLSILTLLFSMSLYGQNVGINTPAPKQILDINGKIVLSDDAAIPTAGAIRYNSTLKQHEGFNGTNWESLSARSTGNLPTNPVPIYGVAIISPAGRTSATIIRSVDDNGFYTAIPAGKFLLVNNFHIESLDGTTSGKMIVVAGPGTSLNGGPLPNSERIIDVSRNSTYDLIAGGGSPLWIVRGGNYFNIENNSSPATTLRISIQGYLVDDLKY